LKHGAAVINNSPDYVEQNSCVDIRRASSTTSYSLLQCLNNNPFDTYLHALYIHPFKAQHKEVQWSETHYLLHQGHATGVINPAVGTLPLQWSNSLSLNWRIMRIQGTVYKMHVAVSLTREPAGVVNDREYPGTMV